jgi:pyrimidine-specific ribonucleoside hydrolase
MKYAWILIVTLFISSLAEVYAHSGKARYHAVLETDGGSGQLRAISLLLASKNTEIIGIYCTGTESEAVELESKIFSMLEAFHHEGICMGRTLDFLKKIYHNEDELITYVCLNSNGFQEDFYQQIPHFKQKTEQIIIPDLNHEPYINEGIPIVEINAGNGLIFIDSTFLAEAGKIKSRYIRSLNKCQDTIFTTAELTAMYLHDTTLFSETGMSGYAHEIQVFPSPSIDHRAVYLDILMEKEPDFKILSQIPVDENYFQEDVAPYIEPIIQAHGLSEWRAGILCFELHGHIGIYAIIGVKMGLRAREYFNIGLDDLFIESHAGLSPPVSCLNDGLQVSTGSTLGHGLITVQQSGPPEVSATFSFKDSKILLSLKPDNAIRMREDIQRCIKENGILTPAYWEAVRTLALDYWLQFDRNQIFTIKKIEKDG